MKMWKTKSWQKAATGIDGNVQLFGVNIYNYEWVGLKKRIEYNCAGVFAKIEIQFGIQNMRSIVNTVNGLVIARDDLSTYYDMDSINKISESIMCLCRINDKISIPASNYFVSLCDSESISSNEFSQLEKLVQKRQQYIYCNETNKCADWFSFHNIEKKLKLEE